MPWHTDTAVAYRGFTADWTAYFACKQLITFNEAEDTHPSPFVNQVGLADAPLMKLCYLPKGQIRDSQRQQYISLLALTIRPAATPAATYLLLDRRQTIPLNNVSGHQWMDDIRENAGSAGGTQPRPGYTGGISEVTEAAGAAEKPGAFGRRANRARTVVLTTEDIGVPASNMMDYERKQGINLRC